MATALIILTMFLSLTLSALPACAFIPDDPKPGEQAGSMAGFYMAWAIAEVFIGGAFYLGLKSLSTVA